MYNFQYVQSKEDVHTSLPKDVEKLVQKESKKKNATKKAAVKKAKKTTKLAQTSQT